MKNKVYILLETYDDIDKIRKHFGNLPESKYLKHFVGMILYFENNNYMNWYAVSNIPNTYITMNEYISEIRKQKLERIL